MTEWARPLRIIGESFLPMLKAGLLLTMPMAVASFGVGLVIASITAAMRLSKIKALQKIASAYVWVFRGTPLLVQLYIVFFGLPGMGIRLGAIPSAIAAFSLNVGAYCSESIRASILAIQRGQWEAAYSLSMTKWQALRRIIAPQSFAIALPPLSNTFISLVKDTSLAANITIAEMFQTTQRIAARTYEPMLLYCLAALIYLAFCTVLTALQAKMEKALYRGR
ncbi:MAG: amino acid ABC transporter permease [Spirochaetaceae bacterium]|jgi:cystine transport system permease protein|nr:amino acid ABC transporter permease [Spirochaetaceae bacterium]